MTRRFDIDLVAWDEARETLRGLRHTVFIEEQGVPEELEWDGLDASAVHVLVRNGDGLAVGTGRLLGDGQIGRMAVLAAHRRRGIGSGILRRLLQAAAGKGLRQVSLNAQLSALSFYERQGFVAEGEEFLDAGIRHRRMVKYLEDDPPDTGAPSRLGALAQLAAGARHGIEVFLHHLDAGLLDDTDFLDAAQRLLLRHPNNHLRICVQQVAGARAACPRLYGLLTRLPSRIELRHAAELQREHQENFALIDRQRYLRRLSPSHHEWLPGEDKGEADRLAALFDEIWLSAEIHPELRTLSL